MNGQTPIGHGTPSPLQGDGHFGAILTTDQVREIRKAYKAGGITQRAMAKQYGVSPTAINQIITRKRWKHV